MHKWVKCPTCEGTGRDPNDKQKRKLCPACKGCGKVPILR